MLADKVRNLYNDEYAAVYDAKFLHSDLARPDAEFETDALAKLLEGGGPWLDVASGTGYFLSQFPRIERTGLDLSPAMIRVAAARNPDVTFHEGDFRQPRRDWYGRWRVVSCMWYAYNLVDSVAEVERVVANLASWTSVDGACFVPLCDPRLVTGLPIPYEVIGAPWPGQVFITGITWSYREGPNSHHEHLVAPHLSHMLTLFSRHFNRVELIDYPSSRQAVIARGKKTDITTD